MSNQYVCKWLTIYAAKGFPDFKFNAFVVYTARSTDICGDNYKYLCDFDYTSAWMYEIYDRCLIGGKSNNTCELYTVTTKNPTRNPSADPSTIPSIEPSIFPTVSILDEEGEGKGDSDRDRNSGRIIFGVGIVLPFIIY